MTEPASIPLASIKLDPQAQPRDHMNRDKIGEYAEAMMLGDEFPPLVVFWDGDTYWLADGFHRLHAAHGCELTEYPCTVHEGTLRDAILFSVGANAQHGYARSNDDKRRSVRRLLHDPEWSAWSDREIARRCRVSDRFVNKLRADIEADTANIRSMDRTFVHPKTGEPTIMATAGINAGRAPPPAPARENSPLVPIPMKSQEEIDVVASFRRDFADNSHIASRLWEIERALAGLPLPELAAERFPEPLLHSFSPERASKISEWFAAFALAFSERKESSDVAAQ